MKRCAPFASMLVTAPTSPRGQRWPSGGCPPTPTPPVTPPPLLTSSVRDITYSIPASGGEREREGGRRGEKGSQPLLQYTAQNSKSALTTVQYISDVRARGKRVCEKGREEACEIGLSHHIEEQSQSVLPCSVLRR